MVVSNGCLISVGNDGKIESIPAASVSVLILGEGTSITSDAARFCAKHDCYIAYARGGLNIHSVWHTGRYQSPEKLAKQAIVFSNPELKLKAAKLLLAKKLSRENAPVSFLDTLTSLTSINEILSLEANWARSFYLKFC